MNSRQKAVLRAVLSDPVRTSIRWADVESLLRALGADLQRGKGSGVRVELNGVRWRFHRPHPGKTCGRGRIEDVRTFLRAAGVEP